MRTIIGEDRQSYEYIWSDGSRSPMQDDLYWHLIDLMDELRFKFLGVVEGCRA